ncbi:MAG TPA: NUDIX hydrolase [Dehalococcoidia bacterium]|nr:NUDIX hydrolase [Dehalococcoidia bacterium]
MTKEYIFCPICGTTLQIGMLEGKERKYCPKCDFVDYKNPLPVALAIAVKDKDFLLIKRGLPPRQGMWASPSGFIEIGETAEEACLRELKEETGVSGEILKLVGVVRREDKEVYGDMLIVEYLVKVANEELKPGSDVEDVRLFSVDELPDYYANFFREVIEEVQNKI